MGREFASAAARWCHILEDVPAPVVVGISDPSAEARAWFEQFPSVEYSVEDYHKLLDKEDIDVIYCAIPHNLHARVYTDIIRAKKHFMGEKPFGMDYRANAEIMRAIEENPDVFVRCSSQHPFYPACQKLISWIREGRTGKILEVRAGLNHSSDMDPNKPINW